MSRTCFFRWLPPNGDVSPPVVAIIPQVEITGIVGRRIIDRGRLVVSVVPRIVARRPVIIPRIPVVIALAIPAIGRIRLSILNPRCVVWRIDRSALMVAATVSCRRAPNRLTDDDSVSHRGSQHRNHNRNE